jgi:hypothetical protein
METLVEAHKELTAEDRCDRCSAAARVRATLINGELYFCGHHAREISTALVLKSVHVYDPDGVFNYGK